MRTVTVQSQIDEEKCNRCQKGIAPCEAACPIHQDIQSYVSLVAKGLYREALDVLLKNNPIPEICGRVCTHPCMTECSRNDVDEPLRLPYMERFVADYVGDHELPRPDVERAERIAIVGSGPSGLMCAYYLRRKGYKVTIFEALPISGGMLAVGIPPYRLPRDILEKSIDRLRRMGIEIENNVKVGKDRPFGDLRSNYDAIFISIGAHKERSLGVEGEELPGVVKGVELLRNFSLETLTGISGKAVVIGGGNSAIDAARTLKRLNTSEVRIVYRRGREEMPAAADEVNEAEKEGVLIDLLTMPIRILGQGRVQEVECIRTELSSPDESGRRKPIPIKDSNFKIPCDYLVVSVGQDPDTLPLGNIQGLEFSKENTFVVDPVTLQTKIEGVFAGGDCVTGPNCVVDAMAAGKKAAISIDRYLNKLDMREGRGFEGPQESRVEVDLERVKKKPARKMPQLEVPLRKGFDEVNKGYTEDVARMEAERCVSCGCRVCEWVCPVMAIRISGRVHDVDNEICNGCKLCESRCPAKAIKMLPRDKIVVRYVDPALFDRQEIAAICSKAGYHPEQVFCFCTGTRAEEVAAAILKGARTPIEISRLTGIRSGCTVECIEPQLKMLRAAGVRVGPAPGWQWYGITPTIWEIPKETREKFSGKGFYFDEDAKLRERIIRGDKNTKKMKAGK